MFKFTRPKTEPTSLDKEIEEFIAQMSDAGRKTDAYQQQAVTLKVLQEARAIQPDPKPTVSPDTIATVAASLLGILIIVGYERANVVTSKAVSFVTKPKI